MRMWWLALLFAGACSAQGGERPHRWPNHRKLGDARFEELEKKTTQLEASNAMLADRVKTLEDVIKALQTKLRAATPEPASPPPAP